jgi:hypothetical protein
MCFYRTVLIGSNVVAVCRYDMGGCLDYLYLVEMELFGLGLGSRAAAVICINASLVSG